MSTDRRLPSGLEGLLHALQPGFAEPKPRDLRDRIAAHLETTDPQAIIAAIADYVGTDEHVDEYVVRHITEVLPPAYGWVVACCDPGELRRRYEVEITELWTIPRRAGACLCSSRRGVVTKAADAWLAISLGTAHDRVRDGVSEADA